MSTEYHCPECGQPAEKPPWLVAREAGFDPSRHCVLWANRMGVLALCYHLHPHLPEVGGVKRQGWRACDRVYECPVVLRWTLVETDKHGRTKEIRI